METFRDYFKDAKAAGLGVTLHIAEVCNVFPLKPSIHCDPFSKTEKNTAEDTMSLLACEPNRLGHATFLNKEARRIVCKGNICIEICLTSNLLWVSVDCLFGLLLTHVE
jgi:adenosine deaminase